MFLLSYLHFDVVENPRYGNKQSYGVMGLGFEDFSLFITVYLHKNFGDFRVSKWLLFWYSSFGPVLLSLSFEFVVPIFVVLCLVTEKMEEKK